MIYSDGQASLRCFRKGHISRNNLSCRQDGPADSSSTNNVGLVPR